MGNIVQTTINPLPGSILIPASRFKGTLISTVVPDPTLSGGAVLFSASGDLTNDGYPEIVITGWSGDDPTHTLLNSPVYIVSTNPSGAAMLDPVNLLGISSIPGTSTPRILDIDKNGLNDFFYLAYNEARTGYPTSNDFAHEHSQLFLQTAPGLFAVSNMTAGKTLSHNSSLGDFNSDGYTDIIAAGGGMELGYFNSRFFNSEAILYLNNKDGTFTPYAMEYSKSVYTDGPVNPPMYAAGSSAAMGDFNNDGRTEIVIADSHVSLTNGFDPNSRNDTWLISNITVGNGEAYGDLSKLPSPYFEDKAAYASFPSFMDKPGYAEAPSFALAEKSHDVKVQTLDVNNDGLLDVMVSSIIWNGSDVTAGGVLQILLNKGNLQFEDVTDSTLYNFFLGKSTGHELDVIDVNGDGFPDIYMPETATDVWSEPNPGSVYQTWANQLLINTGTGKFVQAMWNEFHDLTLSEKSLVPTAGFPGGVHDFKYYPYMLPDGRLGFIKQENAYTADGKAALLFFDFRAESVLSTGPGGTDPALRGAPGFSEYYYLTHYPDVAAAVTAGTYSSGLDQYLKVGRSAGNSAFAPNAIIHGSDNADSLIGREGNETLIANAGNDTLMGGAGNDILDGGIGVDAAVYSGTQATYTVAKSATGYSINDQSGSDGTDALTNIERLQFADTKLALDLDGNAGRTVKLLGAVFGAASASNKQFVGIGLSLLDGGMSYANLMTLALTANGATTHGAVVDLIWTNLFGSAPTSVQAEPFVDVLDHGDISVGALGVLAADLELNLTNVGLVGLQQTGVAYS